jgi:hypothetical protein
MQETDAPADCLPLAMFDAKGLPVDQTMRPSIAYGFNSSSNNLATFRSALPNPSLNQA